MNLGKVVEAYLEKSKIIFKETEKLSLESDKFNGTQRNKKLKEAKRNLTTYYSWLQELDKEYTGDLLIPGTPNNMFIFSVVERARNVFMSSLNGYEKSLANIEANINFRKTTFIAIIALIVSMVGSLAAVVTIVAA